MTTDPKKIEHTDPTKLTRKDFVTDQDVRWCPGCGDYSILAQVQRVFPTFGVARENYVVVSGIGCSSRFPYYMNTYGIHGIHGRAPAIATGVKCARPDLTVWMATGDGDGLSIGGNHLLHVLRRNVDFKILLFNNRIYGLTKGQYSPTSEIGKKTKSTPSGSIDHPIDPVKFALGAGATFVARTVDVDVKHLQGILERAANHKGCAFVEIYQNCNIFNDEAFAYMTDRDKKANNVLYVEHGKPLRFGANMDKAIVLDERVTPKIIDVTPENESSLLVYDETSEVHAAVLSRLTHPEFPTPIGVFRVVVKPAYDVMMQEQIAQARAKRPVTVQQLLDGGETWTVT